MTKYPKDSDVASSYAESNVCLSPNCEPKTPICTRSLLERNSTIYDRLRVILRIIFDDGNKFWLTNMTVIFRWKNTVKSLSHQLELHKTVMRLSSISMCISSYPSVNRLVQFWISFASCSYKFMCPNRVTVQYFIGHFGKHSILMFQQLFYQCWLSGTTRTKYTHSWHCFKLTWHLTLNCQLHYV